MARIPTDDIERLKQQVSLVELVERAGVALERHGADRIGKCPFHDDQTPSFVVSPKKNLFHCFGCNAAGSVIDWVMKTQGVSFRHAAELLLNEAAGTPARSRGKPAKKTTVTKLPPFAADPSDQALLHSVIDYYHETLKESSEALGYLERRGLKHPELIRTFQLGYANRTLGYRLPQKNREAGAAVRGQLEAIGIMRKSGHEHFAGSLIVPVIDSEGIITDVYGRKLRDDLRPGTAKHLYLPGPHRGVWNAQAFTASRELIVCEALIDAMTFWVHGYRNVTAAYGVHGFTEAHGQALVSNHIETVYLAYDNDDAGNRAAEALAEQLLAQGFGCYRIEFPRGMDANSTAVHAGSEAAVRLTQLVQSALWLGKAKRAGGAGATVGATPRALDLALAMLNDDEGTLTIEGRRYRCRGLAKPASPEALKVNLHASLSDDRYHLDNVDLYSSRARGQFIEQAAGELQTEPATIKADLGKLLRAIEQQREAKTAAPPAAHDAMSAAERDEALAFLKAPQLLDRIREDIQRCGLIGEDTNALVGYLAACSRKLDRPLAILIQSTSAAGKSTLMEAVLHLMPKDERVQYSAMTGQSLFYLGETNLKHKILAIAEEEGAHHASYALKLLQSEGVLTIASTGKDETTGNLVTKEYRVEGPVMLILTTTAIDIDEELLNRCLVLTVNESREQTQAIHRLQRERRTLDGLLARLSREDVRRRHRNAQTLLKPLAVMNPYAQALTFADQVTRARRDHEKYLTLIDTIALLHQYQREIKTVEHDGRLLQYLEVTIDDIASANDLAHEILGRTLDELPPQTRRLLKLIHAHVGEQCRSHAIQRSAYRFTRRELRAHTAWSDTALKVHLARLVDAEYVLAHRHGATLRYELVYDATTDGPHLPGLINVERLQNYTYDRNRSGPNGDRSGPKPDRSGSGQPPVRGWSGGGQGEKNKDDSIKEAVLEKTEPNEPKRTSEDDAASRSHVHAVTKQGAA